MSNRRYVIAHGKRIEVETLDDLDPPAHPKGGLVRFRSSAPQSTSKKNELLEPYATIPLRLCTDLVLSDAQWKAFIHLLYHSILNTHMKVLVTAKTTGCTNKRVRHKMLRRLETAGLAKIEWKSRGMAPLATMTKAVELKKRSRHAANGRA
jgi:hypothetical protein